MKQKEKKRIASKLFAALVVLTLISCCFVGTTFARYTTTNSGVASVNVAKWDLDITLTDNTPNGDSIEYNFGKLSPSMDNYTDTSGKDATNTTGHKYVAYITNNSDVNATVTLSADATPTYVLNNGSGFVDQANDYEYNDGLYGNGVSEAQADDVFSIKLYYTKSQGSNYTAAEGAKIELAQQDVVYIYAEVIWTTHYDGLGTDSCVLADAIDTWLGENLASLSWNISYTAVQASQIPANQGN